MNYEEKYNALLDKLKTLKRFDFYADVYDDGYNSSVETYTELNDNGQCVKYDDIEDIIKEEETK